MRAAIVLLLAASACAIQYGVLGRPRLTFAGQFRADTPTRNNLPVNFNIDTFKASVNLDGWYPDGAGTFRFENVTATSLVHPDGTVTTFDSSVVLVRPLLSGSPNKVFAKMVDLDPQQQAVSQIIGMTMRFVDGLDPSKVYVEGVLNPVSLQEMWGRTCEDWTKCGDYSMGGVYQGVLYNVTFPFITSGTAAATDAATEGTAVDAFFTSLKVASGATRKLSVRFSVDLCMDDFNSPTFLIGRTYGIIGVWRPGSPDSCHPGRQMRLVANNRTARAAAFDVWPSSGATQPQPLLVVDFGNALENNFDGSTKDAGELAIRVNNVVIATVPYLETNFFQRDSGVFTTPLTSDQFAWLKSNSLTATLGGGAFLSEQPQGLFVCADNVVVRLDPSLTDRKETVPVWIYQYGQPKAAVQVSMYDNPLALPPPPPLAFYLTGVSAYWPQISVPPAESIMEWTANATTDTSGRALFSVRAVAGPQSPRHVPGQIYALCLGGVFLQSNYQGSLPFVSTRVFDLDVGPSDPTWADVAPILTQYYNLYPAMQYVVDLSDPADVLKYRNVLAKSLLKPFEDPSLMPVSRDMSIGKRDTILKWLNSGAMAPKAITTIEQLKKALGMAVMTELTVIPPYLTALWSMPRSCNVEVAALLKSVVMEEMQHMVLAANVLNAIGGQVDLLQRAPLYPCKLPGGLAPGIHLSTGKASIAAFRDFFAPIELPTIPLANLVPPVSQIRNNHTFGLFYEAIEDGLERLELQARARGSTIFIGNVSWQVRELANFPSLISVTDLDSALAACRAIVSEGEGLSSTDPDEEGTSLSHYYKFVEIVKGRKLATNDNGTTYSYTGEEIVFDKSCVLPLMPNPKAAYIRQKYPAAFHKSVEFNIIYSRLLVALQKVFRGAPETLPDATSLMFALELQARQMVATPLDPGNAAGLTIGLPWEYAEGGHSHFFTMEPPPKFPSFKAAAAKPAASSTAARRQARNDVNNNDEL